MHVCISWQPLCLRLKVGTLEDGLVLYFILVRNKEQCDITINKKSKHDSSGQAKLDEVSIICYSKTLQDCFLRER